VVFDILAHEQTTVWFAELEQSQATRRRWGRAHIHAADRVNIECGFLSDGSAINESPSPEKLTCLPCSSNHFGGRWPA